MNYAKLTADHLLRKAIVYIRQSSPNQMLHHQESQRRQTYPSRPSRVRKHREA
jgi:hypothetical protein